MQSEQLNRIKRLLEKYELGQTSLEEEDVLIAYFNSEEIPSELGFYQAEFRYYAAFKDVRFAGSLAEQIKINENSILQKISQFLSKWYVLSGIALFAGLVIILINQNPQTEEMLHMPDQEEKIRALQLSTDPLSRKERNSNLDDSVHLAPYDLSDYKKIFPSGSDSAHQTHPDSFLHKKIIRSSDDSASNENSLIVPVSPTSQDKDLPKTSVELTSTPTFTRSSSSTISIDPNKQAFTEFAKEQKEQVFPLTEHSTSKELSRIAHLAQKAGIEYTYVVDRHKKEIHELNIVMLIRSTGERSQLWISVPKKSSFSEVLSWTEDENGHAVSLCPSKIEHKVKARHGIE